MRNIVTNQQLLFLGTQGEHLAREFIFSEVQVWEREFGSGQAQLLHKPAGMEASYPAVLEHTKDGWLWQITAADTAFSGNGQAQLQYLVGDRVIKSKTYGTFVANSITESTEEPPDPYKSYMDQVLQVGAKAEQSEATVKNSVELAAQSEANAKESAQNAADSAAAAHAAKEEAEKIKSSTGVQIDVRDDRVGFRRADEETFTYTESLIGPQGERGPQGEQGPAGEIPDMGNYYTKEESDTRYLDRLNSILDDFYNLQARKITRKEDMDALFAAWWRQSCTPETTRLELLERWFGRVLQDDRVHGVKLPLFNTSTSPKGELLGDSVGLTCTPSTATAAGQDDFAGLPQFWCIEASCEKTADGGIEVYAVELIDDLDTVRSGEHLCWVLQKNTYIRDYIEDGYHFLMQRCTPAEGYHQWVDGTTRDGVVHAFAGRPKYAAGIDKNGVITCGSGLAPVNYTPGSTVGAQLWRERGSQYAGASGSLLYWQNAMISLKYGVKGNSGTINGCTGYNFQYEAAVSENNVTRVLLASTQADALYEGSNVIIGNNKDRTQASSYNKCKNVRILRKEEVYVDGIKYVAVYVDTKTPFDVTAGTTCITTMSYWSGWNDGVQGNDGSRFNYTDGKEPGLIQKTEFLTGAYLILATELWQWTADENGDYMFDAYICPDQTKVTTTGTVSADYKKLEGATLRYASGTQNAWQGIEDTLPIEGGLTIWPRATSAAASSTTGCRAGFQTAVSKSGLQSPNCCCSLNMGWPCGLSARSASFPVGSGSWSGLVGAPGMAG